MVEAKPDMLADHRAAVSDALTKVSSFKHTAGSPEMRKAQIAMNYLGYAYNAMKPNDTVTSSPYSEY